MSLAIATRARIERKGTYMSQTQLTTPASYYDPELPPSSDGRLKWRVVDIVVGAVLGIAVGLVFFAWNFVGDAAGDALKLIAPPLKGLLGGMWLLGGVLGGLIIRKPGAAMYVELVAALVPLLFGNPWGLSTLISGLLQGAGAELVFLIFRYRSWKLPVAMLAGALAGVFEALYEIPVWYAPWTLTFKGLYVVCLAASGAILAGVLAWALQRGLAATGALDRFESGREVRQLV